jgi:fibronectin type III domain protein/concanavalin A-like lectin/glucanase superfamily protein/thrombospondin type 3 repeat protein
MGAFMRRAVGALAVCGTLAVGTAQAQVPIIPGAVGFGINTPGGRGGQILRVTNLNDSGPGSLRAALTASGPRIIVFDVSGTIVLSSAIGITNPYVTIAGQTAPSPGITVRGNHIGPRTHNILMQHLRVRTGYGAGVDANTGAIQLYNPGSNPVHDVVIDHCSTSWAINENLTTWGTSGDRVHDVTFRYTISSEGLNCTPISDEGCHSKGLLIGDGNHNIAVLNNIFAHDSDRLPELKGGASAVVVNNIMYNWIPSNQATHLGWEAYFTEPTLLTAEGNAYIQGPNMAGQTAYAIEVSDRIPAGSQVRYNDNLLEYGTKYAGRIELFRNLMSFNPTVTSRPVWVPGLSPLAGSQVEADLLAKAGARPCDRDPVDTRIIDEVRTRTGKIIDNQDEVGGWPALAENRRPAGWDTDNDGMPDSWEITQGFDRNSGADGSQDRDGDGYTNVEEYLHDAADQVECNGPPPPPPAAPSALAASAVSSTRIDLTWQDNANNESGFRVERCQGSTCTNFAQVVTTSANVTGYQDATLVASTTYRYRVVAYNAGGASSYSNVASATTAAPPPPPAAPSNLAATPASASLINLTWQDNANNESGFRIERCQGSTCTNFAQVATTPTDATTLADTSLAASTTYRYRVVAYNTGGVSSYSNVANATTNAPPPPGSVLFQDDFEDGVEDGWSEAMGTWSVMSGSSKVYQQSSTTGDGVTSAGDPVWGDYTVEARVKPMSFNAAGGFVRLIGRFRDVSNYYYLLLRSNQVLELKKLVASTPTTLGTKAFTVSPGTWYTVKLELVGTSLKAYVNGQLELSTTDSQFNSGSIAVGTFNASGEVDDVVVRLPGSAPDTTPPAAPTGLQIIP